MVQSVIPHTISEITIVQLNTLNTAFTVNAYVAYVTSPYIAAGIIILNNEAFLYGATTKYTSPKTNIR